MQTRRDDVIGIIGFVALVLMVIAAGLFVVVMIR